MGVYSPAPGSLLRSVALRYRPRTPHQWTAPPVRRIYARFESSPANAIPAGGDCRRDERTALVEAVLLAARGPIPLRRIAQAAGLDDPTQARTLVRRLNELYRRGESPFRVVEVAGGWQLMTHPALGGWLRRIHPGGSGVRLSAPALETLAIVAYRQPVLRAEVESIRGVQCGEMLRQLMDRDLVRIVGKSHDLGRPFLYGTTPRFLETFGLRNLDDLPRASELRPAADSKTHASEAEVIPGPVPG